MKTEFIEDQYSFAYPDGIEHHWWHIARSKIIRSELRKKLKNNSLVLDVGCGRGITVKHLKELGINCKGVEPAIVNPVNGVRNSIFIGKSLEELPEDNRNQYDFVLLLDVIEHIPDSIDFFKSAISTLPNLKNIILTVPACPELWSNYDDFYNHYKRYTVEMIEEIAVRLDWQLLFCKHFYHFLYLPARINLKLYKNRSIKISAPRGMMKYFHKLAASLALVDYFILPKNLPGTSIISWMTRKA